MRKDYWIWGWVALAAVAGTVFGLTLGKSASLTGSITEYVSAIAAVSVALTAWRAARAWRHQVLFQREYDSLQELRAALLGLGEAKNMFLLHGAKWADRLFPGSPDNIFRITNADLDPEQISANLAHARSQYRKCAQKCDDFVTNSLMDMTADKVDLFIDSIDRKLRAASPMAADVHDCYNIVIDHSAMLERLLRSSDDRIARKLGEMRAL